MPQAPVTQFVRNEDGTIQEFTAVPLKGRAVDARAKQRLAPGELPGGQRIPAPPTQPARLTTLDDPADV